MSAIGQFATVEVASAERRYRSGWLGPKDKERPMNMDALERAMRDPATLKRFWSKVAKADDGACWLWTRGQDGNGYGAFLVETKKANRRHQRAHRAAWIATFGAIPNGLCVCHRCDVRLCCNPSHLFLGTPAENAYDRDAKGRDADHRGECNGRAKLTASQVLEIRAAVGSQSEIGRRFGVDQTTISRIRLRTGWRCVQ